MMEDVHDSIDRSCREGLPIVALFGLTCSRRMPANEPSWPVQRRLSKHFDAGLGGARGSFGFKTVQSYSRRMKETIGYLNP